MDNITTQQVISFENLILWKQAIGLIIAFIFAIFSFWLFNKIRSIVWKRATYSEGKIATRLNRNWGVVILLGALLFFGYVIIIVILLFGQDRFVEGIVVASALTVFIIFQLPRLLKPHVHITFLPPDKEGENTRLEDLEKPLSSVSLQPSKKHTLNFYVSHLGINIYENWNFILSSKDTKINILKSPSSPAHGLTPRGNAEMCFATPNIPYGPDDNLMLSFDIQTPQDVGSYQITTVFKCSTRWGETTKEMTINIKES